MLEEIFPDVYWALYDSNLLNFLLSRLNVKKEKIMSTYNFQTTIASRGYHVYKETTWSKAKVNEKVKIEIETNQSSIAIDPFFCAVKAKEKYFDG